MRTLWTPNIYLITMMEPENWLRGNIWILVYGGKTIQKYLHRIVVSGSFIQNLGQIPIEP